MAGFTEMQDYTLTELFKKMDSDNSGSIDASELRQVLVQEGVDLSPVEAAGLLGRLDSLEVAASAAARSPACLPARYRRRSHAYALRQAADVELDLEEFKTVMVGSAADMGAVVERFSKTLRVMKAERKAPADLHPATVSPCTSHKRAATPSAVRALKLGRGACVRRQNGWAVAGRPWVSGHADGPARHATLTAPQGLVYDAAAEALYIADRHSLRRIALGEEERLGGGPGGAPGGTVETISGDEWFGRADGLAGASEPPLPPSRGCSCFILAPACRCRAGAV